MVYIYKKTTGSKDYYYLRASERKGKRVLVKDIAYLGNSIKEVKENLEKLPKYKDQIRKSYKILNNFLESNHFLEKVKELKLKQDKLLQDKTNEVAACKLHYKQVFTKLPELTKQEILKNYIIEFAYNTASIEGNTINLEEARNLLNEGITPKDKTLREVYDLQNTEKVFFELWKNKEKIKLDNKTIVKVHGELLKNIDERKGYRTTDIRVIHSNFDATPGKYVLTDMNLLLKWFDKHKKDLHPLVLALIFHHKFEKVHPFSDGNGRTGRMLANLILMKNNYPTIVIHKKTRRDYLESMRKADECDLWALEDEKYSEMIQYGVHEFIGSYWSLFL